MDLIGTKKGKSIIALTTTHNMSDIDYETFGSRMEILGKLLLEANIDLEKLVDEYHNVYDGICSETYISEESRAEKKKLYDESRVAYDVATAERHAHGDTPEYKELYQTYQSLDKKHSEYHRMIRQAVENHRNRVRESYSEIICEPKRRVDRLTAEMDFLVRKEQDAILKEAREKLEKLKNKIPRVWPRTIPEELVLSEEGCKHHEEHWKYSLEEEYRGDLRGSLPWH